MSAFRNMVSKVISIVAIGAAAVISGCASSDSAGYAGATCAEGEERVRVGPRGQMPDYVCR